MAVRVVVLSRKPGDSAWKPLWGADLLTHDEQLVELPSGKTGGADLRLWTHRLPDGAIAVDGDLALSGKSPVRSSFRGIQQPAVPQRVFSLETDEAEYQVYQTVAMLGR